MEKLKVKAGKCFQETVYFISFNQAGHGPGTESGVVAASLDPRAPTVRLS